MSTPTAIAGRRKLPSLDGWRALSISFVLIQHSTFTSGFPSALTPIIDNWFSLGAMGVHFFFVISGFLITWLLLKEQAGHGRISLKHFYIRRALRILPVYLFYLGILGFATCFSQPLGLWAMNLTFTTNFGDVAHPVAHFWSLAVEEQFYLIWPWLLAWRLYRGSSFQSLLWTLSVPILLSPLFRLLECKHWYPEKLQMLFHSGSFFLCSDSLAWGCLAAVLMNYIGGILGVVCEKNARLIFFLGMGLILMPAILYLLEAPGRIKAMSTLSFWGLGFSLLLVQSIVNPALTVYRWLNWTWVSHLGVLSYSIYIWQQMFCGTSKTVFGMSDAGWLHFPAWILCALLAAHASYYLLEKPVVGLRAKFR